MICQPYAVFIGSENFPSSERENAAFSNSGIILPVPNHGIDPPDALEAMSSEYCMAISNQSAPFLDCSYIAEIFCRAAIESSAHMPCVARTILWETFTCPWEGRISLTYMRW